MSDRHAITAGALVTDIGDALGVKQAPYGLILLHPRGQITMTPDTVRNFVQAVERMSDPVLSAALRAGLAHG